MIKLSSILLNGIAAGELTKEAGGGLRRASKKYGDAAIEVGKNVITPETRAAEAAAGNSMLGGVKNWLIEQAGAAKDGIGAAVKRVGALAAAHPNAAKGVAGAAGAAGAGALGLGIKSLVGRMTNNPTAIEKVMELARKNKKTAIAASIGAGLLGTGGIGAGVYSATNK